MARIVKQEEFEERRNKILDVAQRLAYAQGYDQMSIQDILDGLKISKGAFYHYFSSKQALLEALIERLAAQVMQLLDPVVRDGQLNATEKMLRFFDVAARWKTARKDYLLTLMSSWYADENAILRQKSQAALVPLIDPLLTAIVRQGVKEGQFQTSFPDQACGIILSLLQSYGDTFVRLICQPELSPQDLQRVQTLTASYQEAVEHILGAEPGSLPLFDSAILREWLPPSKDQSE